MSLKNLRFIWVSTLLLKLIVSAVIPLTTDEAYYWVWSNRLQLSYYDHPPFIAWLFWLGHFLEPLGNAVRWPSVLLGHLTLLIWIFIWKQVSPKEDSTRTRWWLWLALCSPLFGFGSIILTPDLPVMFFWSCSLLFLLRALKNQSLSEYALLGASLGLGFCSKYHIVLFVPLLLIYLTLEKKWRDVSWKGVLLAVLLGVIFSTPVLAWNFQHDFISFKYQLKHGLGRPTYKPYWTWTYVLAQVMVLFPTVVWAAAKARLSGLARSFLYFGWGPLVFFFLSSFKGLVEVNWPVIAYPAFFAIAALGASSFRPLKIANWFWIFLFLILGSHVVKPWIPSAPDKLSEFSQYDPILPKLTEYQPLYASTYQMASWIWYETKQPFFKLNGLSRFDLFDTFPESFPQNYPIYIAMKKDVSMPDWMLEDKQYKFKEVEKLADDYVIIRVDK